MNIRKNGMKILFLLITYLCLWTTSPVLAEEKKTALEKVAVVNGYVITQDEFERELVLYKQRMTRVGRPVNSLQLPFIRKKVLEGLVNRELLYQEAKKTGIRIEDSEIEAKLKSTKLRFKYENGYKRSLKNMNLTEDKLRSQIEKRMIIQKFVEKKFEEKILVSKAEAKEFYDKNRKVFTKPEQVRASHILIKVTPKADQTEKASALKKTEDIHSRLKKGEDFATLASQFSEGPSKANGGDLGYFRRGQMVKSFEETAFKLKPGEVSGPVETQFGYHLIKVVDKKKEELFSFDEVEARLMGNLKRRKVQEELGKYISEVKKMAKVERLLEE